MKGRMPIAYTWPDPAHKRGVARRRTLRALDTTWRELSAGKSDLHFCIHAEYAVGRIYEA